MKVHADFPLPLTANDNVNPLHDPATALLELHRLRRQLIAKDKAGYSPGQWHRHFEALKGLDEAISLIQPYL